MEEMGFLIWGLSVKVRYDYDKSKMRSFPPYFFLEAIPDASDLISKYNILVRQGLSNFEFATIYEARKTRATIVAGFKSLASAVHDVSNTLQEGFSSLNRQLESNARDQIRATEIQTLIMHYGLRELR